MKKLILIAILLISGSASAVNLELISHSGGTDAYGCHSGSQPFHCH